MEIKNSYGSVYQNTYEVQKQQTSGRQAALKTETKETSATWKSTGAATGITAYFSKLAKLAPSVACRIGTAHSAANKGKTLTIHPKLLEKMQDDPALEKEMTDMIKGVEYMTKWTEGLHKATGWTTVFRHSYIDENGKYSHIALTRNDFMLNMSDKLREERRQNAENLINKLRGKPINKTYLGKLQKQIPSMILRVGNHIPTANDKRVSTLTVHPGILAQMQSDPEKEKYYIQRMKDIEGVEKMARGAAKAPGSTREYSHWYIDGEGKIWHTARIVRKDNLNEKLRKQAQVNAEKHIAKIRENTRKRTGRISKQKRSFDMRI